MGGKDTGEQKESPMIKIASFIVDKRMLFFLIYIILIIFSVVARGWVGVENNLSYYLPTTTQTKQGIDLMNKEFTTFGQAKVMVANIGYDDALQLKDEILNIDGVQGVTFTKDTDDEATFKQHYNNGSALYAITFDYPESDDRALEALRRVEDKLENYDIYVTTSMGNQQGEIIEKEVSKIMILVAVVVFVVLLLTTESTGEIPILCITFVVSLIVNSGTNFLYGTISFVSNSVCAILQLGLSVDYAIMYCNRFKEERSNGYDVRDAAIVALSKSIPEIFASSLTTVGGLFAMMFMQYGIGADLGKVLIKSIFISLIVVFTLMPGLLVLFANLVEKTKHRNLVPKISMIGKFDYRTRHIVPILFVVIFIGAAYLQSKCPYVYGYTSLKTPLENSIQVATRMIDDNFGTENFVAVVVPGHDYKTEAKLIRELEDCDEVDHCQGLANTQALGDYVLTDALTPRQFSELVGLDYEQCELLYSAYAADKEEYGKIVGGVASYKVELMDMVQFAQEMVDEGYVTLDDKTMETLDSAGNQIANGRKQLESADYDRILVYLSQPLPEKDESAFDFLTTIHDMAQNLYEGQNVYVAGNATSQKDLRDTFDIDNDVVTYVSMLFVLVVLLFTFKSAGLPVLLIVVIEGAVFCNFSYPTIANSKLFFMSYLIVSSIQMGANIDYAIAISSRYTDMRRNHEHSRKESIIEALNFAFPTIITSGSMMIFAGLFIGQMTSDACISSIGQCLARGTTISVVLVLFVLPQMLVVGDKIIEKTTFDIARPIKSKEEHGRVYVNGTIRGEVHGRVIGTMNAFVIGDVRAVVVSGDVHSENGDDETVDMRDPAEIPEDLDSDREREASGDGNRYEEDDSENPGDMDPSGETEPGDLDVTYIYEDDDPQADRKEARDEEK